MTSAANEGIVSDKNCIVPRIIAVTLNPRSFNVPMNNVAASPIAEPIPFAAPTINCAPVWSASPSNWTPLLMATPITLNRSLIRSVINPAALPRILNGVKTNRRMALIPPPPPLPLPPDLSRSPKIASFRSPSLLPIPWKISEALSLILPKKPRFLRTDLVEPSISSGN